MASVRGRRLRPLSEPELRRAREDPFGPTVLGESHIVCLECGVRLRGLQGHLTRLHGMTAAEYKAAWGYNASQALKAGETVELHQEASQRAVADGRVTLDPVKASRMAPRRKKGWRAREQGERATRKGLARRRTRRGKEAAAYRDDVTLERILSLQEAGHALSEIAQMLDCGKDVIRNRLREAGRALPKVSEDVMQRRHSNGLRPLPNRPDVTTQSVIEALSEGLSMRAAAQKLRCSVDVVRRRAAEADVEYSTPLRRADIDVQAVLEAYHSGSTWREMERTFDATTATLKSRLKIAGVDVTGQDERYRSDVTAERALSLREKGLSLDAIAKELKCTPSLVSKRLAEVGHEVRRLPRRQDVSNDEVRALRERGLSISEIADALSCSATTIARRIRHLGISVPNPHASRHEVTAEEIARLRAEGASVKQIAARFGCSVSLVYLRLGER